MVAESANMSVAQLAAASSRGLIGGAAAGATALNATQPFLFIGVLTHPNATERRRAVRETWVAAASQEVDYKFVHYQARSQRLHPLHMLCSTESSPSVQMVPSGSTLLCKDRPCCAVTTLRLIRAPKPSSQRCPALCSGCWGNDFS